MNAKQLIALSAVFFFGQAAFAQEASSDAWMHVASTKSRAEVQAEAVKGRAASIQASGGEASVVADAPASTKSRDDVRAEARANPRRFTPDVYNVGA
jgi:hypothetical protein